MFVRTKEGKILKCFKSESMNLPIYYVIDSKTNSYVEYQDVKKVSENVIDIVEVGDYVNGLKVTKLGFDKLLLNCKTIECHQEDLSNGYEGVTFVYTNKDIKSIVTKEQFESMSYKVED